MNARYEYDNERRLLIPKYAGSRWGAVQQYKEDGHLEYQDWWVKDLREKNSHLLLQLKLLLMLMKMEILLK